MIPIEQELLSSLEQKHSTKIGRRLFLTRLFGASSALLLAACGPQHTPQIAPVAPAPGPAPESKPVQANPIAPEVKLPINTNTPENRAKEWFKAVVTGNIEEHKKQFPPNDSPQQLQPGLTERYKNCNIDQAAFTTKKLPDGTIEVIVDFKKPCIPAGKTGPAQYVRVTERVVNESGQIHYYIETAAPYDGH